MPVEEQKLRLAGIEWRLEILETNRTGNKKIVEKAVKSNRQLANWKALQEKFTFSNGTWENFNLEPN